MKQVIMGVVAAMAMIVMADNTVNVTKFHQSYPYSGRATIEYTVGGTLPNNAVAEIILNTDDASATFVQSNIVAGANSHVIDFASSFGGALVLTNASFVVAITEGGVQLWENGPYWAECNVGAARPEDYGYYFWWGDTVGYTWSGGTRVDDYSYSDVTWVSSAGQQMDSSPYMGKTCITYGKDDKALLSAGYIDSTGNLVAALDAATAHLGAPWRMPTAAEFAALVSNCTTTWTTRNGVYGRLVTGNGAYADRSIFLPAAGAGYYSYLSSSGERGYYWSSTRETLMGNEAVGLFFRSGEFERFYNFRDTGSSVRPVRGFTPPCSAFGVVTYDPALVGPMSYLDPTGDIPVNRLQDDYAVLNDETAALSDGWFVAAPGMTTISNRIEITGSVNILLCDGAELTASQGFHVAGANSLTVWEQSNDRATAGKLTVLGADGNAAGIGGNDTEAGGVVTVNGGVLDITGGYKSAGIGGGRNGAGGTTTINGGFVTVRGGDWGTGIGGGMAINGNWTSGNAGTTTINGGEVAATGGRWCAAIGGAGGTNSENGSGGGTVVINGGTVAATGGIWSAGIGGGRYAGGVAVAICGGTVTAAGNGAQAIGEGNGWNGAAGILTIDGMRVFASASATEPVAASDRMDTCRGSWAKLEVCPHGGNGSSCPWCGVVLAYAAWAEANGVAGAWDETDALGIHNVFRYAFDKPVGAFENPPLLDIEIEGGNVVVKTPPVTNSAGFALSVVESSDIAGATVTRSRSLDAAGRAVFAMEGTSRFYRLAATPGDANLGGVQLWKNGPYWAECNVGATRPEEYGYYFWWGDTVGYTRSGGTWTDGWYYSGVTWVSSTGVQMNNSPFTDSSCPTYGKDNSALQAAGYTDSTGNLVAAHDAATAYLGSPWRMPTHDEIDALISNCTTTWITTNGVYGQLVTGKGDYANRRIFLPAAGDCSGSGIYNLGSCGFYWSSTLDTSILAWCLYLESGSFGTNLQFRDIGRSVRPVRGVDE